MRRLIKTLVAILAVMAIALPGSATGNHGGNGLECPGKFKVPINTVVHGDEGSQHLLKQVSVPSELQGATAAVSATAENQSSVHPGNDLVVASGGTSVVLEDVEREAGVTTNTSGELTLGSNITVTLVMGQDKVFSAGIVVSITCEQPPPPPTEEFGASFNAVCAEAGARLTGTVTSPEEGFALIFADGNVVAQGEIGPETPFNFDVIWPAPAGTTVEVRAGVDFGDGQSFVGEFVLVEYPCEDTTTTTIPEKPTTTQPPAPPTTEPPAPSTTAPPVVSPTTAPPTPSTTGTPPSSAPQGGGVGIALPVLLAGLSAAGGVTAFVRRRNGS